MNNSKINLNKEIIALFSGQSSTLTIPKLYIKIAGTVSRGNVLNQCVFWSNKSNASDGFFYKTYSEWYEEICIPERTLRRILNILEKNEWIQTKVKKVSGLNVLHIKPDIDKIIDSIKNKLIQEDPNRPQCPNGLNAIQNICTNIAPAGQSGRSEPAKVAESYIRNTDDHLQITTTTAVSSFIFSKKTDKEILKLKLNRDFRSDKEFLDECLDHTENNSDKQYPKMQRALALIKLLKRCKDDDVIFREFSNKNKKTSNPEKKRQTELAEQKKRREESINPKRNVAMASSYLESIKASVRI